MKNNNYKSILKYATLMLLLVTFTFNATAQAPSVNPFVTNWFFYPTGATFSINIQGEYYYTWEKVTSSTTTQISASNHTGSITLTAPDNGDYRLSIYPTGTTPFHSFTMNSANDAQYLEGVEHWGDVTWSTMNSMFNNAYNLINFPTNEVPTLTNVTDMSFMFFKASSFNKNISNWNVSNVTNMSAMFEQASSFNQPLNNWNVSNVRTTASMFAHADKFDQPLNNWNLSNDTNMNYMFYHADVFNQDISNWNVGNVKYMANMFSTAKKFNQPLNNWNVSNVTTMSNMFSNAQVFNQPLNNWNISNVTDMSSLFYGANLFNQELGNWEFNSAVTFDNNSFANTAISCENYSLSLYGWSQNNTATGRVIEIPKYYSTNVAVVNARNYLTQTLGWDITDNGPSAACLVSLPIHLGSFKAIAHQSQVNLEWNTFAEMNNKGFEVQRSADGRNWENMTWMISQAENGNSSELLSYYFTDYTPLKGSNYYRLKQVDVDGKVTYSETRVVNMESNNITNYVVYPNPVQQELNISNLIGTEKVEITNAMGALVMSQQATSKISLNTLPTGMYLVKIIDANGQAHQEKIIKE